jgi:predicted ABC-type ATPase
MARPELSKEAVDLRAAREMLKRIDALADAQEPFMFETTLASLSYARKVKRWRRRGYHVALIYLRLPDVQASIERVRRRVAAGGPDAVIRTRFAKSWKYLEELYRPAVDEWYIWDSLEGEFRLAQSWGDR